MDKVALVQVSAYCCFPLQVSLNQCSTLTHLLVALTSEANGQTLGTFRNANALAEIGKHSIEKQLSLTLSMVVLTHTSPAALNIGLSATDVNRLVRKLRGKNIKVNTLKM